MRQALAPTGKLRVAVAAIADVDRLGIRVGVTAGGSSHATLLRELMHATVVPSPSLTAGI